MANKNYRGIKAVKQEDRNSCWAACLEWWLKSVENRKKMEQWELLIEYSDYCNSDGTITKWGIYNIVNDPRWNMENKCFVGFQADYEKFSEHASRGPIFCAFTESGTSRKHVNVIYSVYQKNNVCKVKAMEPDGGKHVIRNLSYYNFGLSDIWLASPKF